MKRSKCRICKQYVDSALIIVDPRLQGCYFNFCCPRCIEGLIEEYTYKCKYCDNSYVTSHLLRNSPCPQCILKDSDALSAMVHRANAQARAHGNEAILTVEEWAKTMRHFSGMCAYCLVKPCELIEHIIPQRYGYGSTVRNCAPCCIACNSLKKHYLPQEIAKKYPDFHKSLCRVMAYLSSR